MARTALVVPITTTFVASQRAANAADAAALAAADAISGAVPGVAVRRCGADRRAATGRTLASCETDGAGASRSPCAVSALGMGLAATARAGPPGWAG